MKGCRELSRDTSLAFFPGGVLFRCESALFQSLEKLGEKHRFFDQELPIARGVLHIVGMNTLLRPTRFVELHRL